MLEPVFAKVCGAFGRSGHAGRTVTVKVKYADFQQITRSRSGMHSVVSREALERTSLELLRPCSRHHVASACSVSQFPISPPTP